MQVIRSLKNAMQPAVTNARVHFSLPVGYSAKVAPEEVPPIFFGERTIVYGILQKSLLGKVVSGSRGTVTLEGELLGEKIKHVLEFKVSGQGPEAGAVPTIHHLAGKALIKGMENMESSKKDEIVKLSCECSVISKHTAFIAIDEEQKEPVKGSLQTWDVVARPPPMMGGWRSFSLACSYTASYQSASYGRHDLFSTPCLAAPPRALASYGAGVDRFDDSDSDNEEGGEMEFEENAIEADLLEESNKDMKSNLAEFNCMASAPPLTLSSSKRMAKDTRSKPSSSSSSWSPQPALPRIISLQLASGVWKLSADLAGLLGHSLEELKTACPAVCEGELELVWATVLVLGYLEKKLLELQDEWELIAMKAKNWLKKQHVPEGHSTDSFLEKAKTVL